MTKCRDWENRRKNPTTMAGYGARTTNATQRHSMELAWRYGSDSSASCFGTRVFDDIFYQFSCEMRNKVKQFGENSAWDATGCYSALRSRSRATTHYKNMHPCTLTGLTPTSARLIYLLNQSVWIYVKMKTVCREYDDGRRFKNNYIFV